MVWESEGFEVDAREYPLIRVHFPHTPTEAGYRALFAHYAELCERGKGIGWLIDFREFDPVFASPAIRAAAAAVFKQYRGILLAATHCEGRVASNAVSRGILTAFDWLTGPKWECKNFAELSDAEAWVRSRLQSAH